MCKDQPAKLPGLGNAATAGESDTADVQADTASPEDVIAVAIDPLALNDDDDKSTQEEGDEIVIPSEEVILGTEEVIPDFEITDSDAFPSHADVGDN